LTIQVTPPDAQRLDGSHRLRRRFTTGLLVLAIAVAAPLGSGAALAARGDGATLVLAYWQSVAVLNPHLAQGSKDLDAARLILEPLASMGPDGKPVPALAATIPTLANGGISGDRTTVTWTLEPGVKWSDGSDFTAEDVAFTFQYMSNPEVGATTSDVALAIASVVAADRDTVVVTYRAPTWAPYSFGVGPSGMILQKAQFEPYNGANAHEAPGNFAPIGTGPYKLSSFTPGDKVTYEINESYRDPGKPFFRGVEIVTTSGPEASARAVFESATADYGWNLLVSSDLLRSLIKLGNGKLVSAPSSSVERILLNRADPARDSEPTTKHPFLSDRSVRKAFAMAIDRTAIAGLYGLAGDPTCNLVTGVPEFTSTRTASFDVCKFDMASANKLLDKAGWKKRDVDGIRVKEGVPLRVLFQTTTNTLRAAEFSIIAAGWRQLGVDVAPLKAVPASIFFGPPTNTDSAVRFLADFEMFTNASNTDPTPYLAGWLSSSIPQMSNGWEGSNYDRFSRPKYDRLFGFLTETTDPTTRAALIIEMNDLLVADVVEIPLVARRSPLAGKAMTLLGVIANTWESDTWNVADWSR